MIINMTVVIFTLGKLGTGSIPVVDSSLARFIALSVFGTLLALRAAELCYSHRSLTFLAFVAELSEPLAPSGSLSVVWLSTRLIDSNLALQCLYH